MLDQFLYYALVFRIEDDEIIEKDLSHIELPAKDSNCVIS